MLMTAATPGVSPTTGWPTGFWCSELTHPYRTFAEAGCKIDIVSPKGCDLIADSYCDPEDPPGYSAHDILSLGFRKSAAHAALLNGNRSISQVIEALER